MKCLIGLGNPGDQYKDTKHNFGYWVVDSYLEKNNLKLKLGKGDYVFAKNEAFIIAKTATAMNNSGHAVKNIIDYFNLNLEDVIIIYDDIDLLCLYRFPRKILTSDIFSLKNNDYMK